MDTEPTLPPAMPATLVSCDAAQLAWVPWAMRGTHFKLLHADPDSGRFTLLIKMAANVTAPVHRHVGAVEGYLLDGGFHYHDAPHIRFTAGCYLLEHGGAVHQ